MVGPSGCHAAVSQTGLNGPGGLLVRRPPRPGRGPSNRPRLSTWPRLAAETAERAERRERRRLIDARFPALKRLEGFRFDDNRRVPRATIAALAQGSWIQERESVIFVGDSGTGKTMLATALGVAHANKDDESGSPPSPLWRTSSKKP
jgi:hypothetical protein